MSFDLSRAGSPASIGMLLVLASGASSCAASRAVLPAVRDSGAARSAQDPDAGYRSEFYARQGFHVGVRAHGSRLEGDFDGDTALIGPDTIFVPDADDGTGYELLIGWMTEGDAYRFTYTQIDYDGEIGGIDSEIESQTFGLEMVHYLRANSPLQPFFQFGFLFPLMDLDDASTNGVEIGDGELRGGFGLSAGGGVAWWLTHRVALDVRAQYTYQWFDAAEGVSDDEEDIDDAIDASNYGVSVGLIWVLGGRS